MNLNPILKTNEIVTKPSLQYVILDWADTVQFPIYDKFYGEIEISFYFWMINKSLSSFHIVYYGDLVLKGLRGIIEEKINKGEGESKEARNKNKSICVDVLTLALKLTNHKGKRIRDVRA